MPTYEYVREDGTTFEIFQNINDEALKTCPETGQKVKRVITGGGGVVYKGDGFYITDYKNGGRPSSPSDNKADSGKSKSSESKSEPSTVKSED